jgi:hypothetical protein
MKKIFFVLVFHGFFQLVAQKNYLIEYDKLGDKLTYYSCNWVKGAQKKQQVDEIKLTQNDVVTFKIINVNNFIYDVDILNHEVRTEEKESPFKTILGTFSGLGGPAFSLLTSLGSNPPNPLAPSRGVDKQKAETQKRCSDILSEMHQTMTQMIKTYSSFEKTIKVKYAKNLTKEEILAKLKMNSIETSELDMEELNAHLKELSDELNTITDTEFLDLDDPLWEEVNKVEGQYQKFTTICLTEEGELKPYSLLEIISDVESNSFVVEHRFLAKAFGEYGNKFSSNDFLLIFKEKQDLNDEIGSDNTIIDFSKFLSLPIKQDYFPSWSLGVDYVLPLGGITEYVVQQIPGDFWAEIPDSILITNGKSKSMQLAIGTKLIFDIPTKNQFIIPNAVLGMAISGLNSSDNGDWKLNFILGGGMSFKSFPFISINAGFIFSQQKVLKDDFALNRTFVKPNEFSGYNPDPSILFKNKFKPGLFFGVNFKF